MADSTYYVLQMWGCVEPILSAALPSYEAALEKSRVMVDDEGLEDHSYVCLRVGADGTLEAIPFSGAELLNPAELLEVLHGD